MQPSTEVFGVPAPFLFALVGGTTLGGFALLEKRPYSVVLVHAVLGTVVGGLTGWGYSLHERLAACEAA